MTPTSSSSLVIGTEIDPCVPIQVAVQAEGGPSADRVGVSRVDRREFLLLWVPGSPGRMAVVTHVRRCCSYRCVDHVFSSQQDVPVCDM